MKVLEKILIWVAGIALIAAALLMVANIITRLAFHYAIPGTYELIGYFALLFGCTVLPVGTIARSHITVDIVTSHLPGVPFKAFQIFTSILEVLTYIVLAYGGFILAMSKFASHEASDTLKIPVAPLRMFWAVCVAITIIVKIIQLVMIIKNPPEERSKGKEDAEING